MVRGERYEVAVATIVPQAEWNALIAQDPPKAADERSGASFARYVENRQAYLKRAGLDLPSSGEVHLAGHALAALDEDQRARVRAEHVGFVFQSFQLLDSLNALENVMLPLELDGRRDARERATELLGRVGLGERLHHYPRQLSGGEQQRVALARAFAAEPDVLFADEPTGNLDTHTGAHITELLFELNRERGTTLVLVTHDERLAKRCHRMIRLEGGRQIAAEAAE